MNGSEDYLGHKDRGTTDGMISRNTMDVFPTRNFRYGCMEGWEAMTGAEYRLYGTSLGSLCRDH